MQGKWLLPITVTLGFGAVGAWFGRTVPFAEQWPLYDALRTTASIVFGVMGAWLSLLYPDVLSRVYKGQLRDDDAPESKRISVLLMPIQYSTFVIAMVLVAGLVAPVLKHAPWTGEYRLIFRAVSFALLTGLTALQLWAVVLSIWPARFAKSKLEAEEERQGHKESILGKAKRPVRAKPDR